MTSSVRWAGQWTEKAPPLRSAADSEEAAVIKIQIILHIQFTTILQRLLEAEIKKKHSFVLLHYTKHLNVKPNSLKCQSC